MCLCVMKLACSTIVFVLETMKQVICKQTQPHTFETIQLKNVFLYIGLQLTKINR